MDEYVHVRAKNRREAATVRQWKRRAAGIAIAGALAVGGSLLPRDALCAFGQGAALTAVGLGQAGNTVQWLSDRLEGTPATTTPSATAPATTTTIPFSGTEQRPHAEVKVPAQPEKIPEEDGSGGRVVEQQMSVGSSFVEGVAIKNKSSKTPNIAAELKIAPDVHLTDTAEPQVLILHTHTTESYMPYYAGYYNAGDTNRSTDNPYNVTVTGEAIAEQLRAAGIAVIHDTTVHDSPKYRGAYDRSLATAEKVMKQYPTIKVVLDIHRDGIMLNAKDKVKPTATINGKKAAQIMMICGMTSTNSIPHPHWQENFRFALRLQQALATRYEGLMRPLSLVDSRYNQHVANGALLIEVGSEGNTMEEAVYSGQLLGETLAAVLEGLKE